MNEVFEIIAKIYNGNELVKYEVLDKSTNRKKILSVEMVQGLAMAGGLINAKFNEKTRTLSGINGHDLRILPKKQEQVEKNHDFTFHKLTGNRLWKFVKDNAEQYTKERYIIEKLMTFLTTPCNGKICALYGLRRTGKTVLMYHAIKRLFDMGKNKVAFLSLTEHDALSKLFKELQSLTEKGIEYIFIDEITALNGFLQSSALLADKYAKMGVHIVIAGTDSFVLELANRDNLYDRMLKIHTTYIGYQEYEYLNQGTDILDYIRIGGVLPADIFYNEEKTKDYINTAISNNIINSLLRGNNRKQYQRLIELAERGLLKKAIEQAIEASNEELTINVITKSYINGTLGSAKQLLEAVFHIDDTLDTEEVEDRVRYKLSIVKKFDMQISDEYVEELKDFLIEIGVIQMYTRYVCSKRRVKKVEVPIFVQPGLRYHQTVALINALCETSSFFELPKNIREQLQQKIIEDVEGNLIEHEILLCNLNKQAQQSIEVTQLNYEGKEIDMLIHNNESLYLFEIKRSTQAMEHQARWLINDEINDYMESFFDCKVKKREVLYLGETKTVTIQEKCIVYRNIHEFLKEKQPK